MRVSTAKRSRRQRYSSALAAGGALLFGSAGATWADPPAGAAGGVAASPSASATQPPEIKQDFVSSVKQGFSENADRDVVVGHFDVGTPPNTHRFYCLLDPKTGKREPNGVAGEPVPRRDGTTGIRGVAVSPLSCADAERKGLLVTTGYTVRGSVGSPTSPATLAPNPALPTAAPTAAASAAPAAVASVAPAAVASVAPAAAASVAPTAAASAGPAAAGSVVDGAVQTEVMAVYARFVAAQNAHDRTAVSEVLLDSKDFVWAPNGGDAVWGYQEALTAFEHAWKGTWKLDPQSQEVRVANPSPGVALLVTPLRVTAGDPGQSPSTAPVRWSGVFLKTKSGWRISSIFTTPLTGSRARNGP
jgi:ketosteroid isomerase-like protein